MIDTIKRENPPGQNPDPSPSDAAHHFDPVALFPDLRVGVYRLTFRPLGCNKPNEHAGSAWRGAMGWALQELSCPFDAPSCSDCPFVERCPYYLFYVHEGDTPGFKDPPRPYILSPVLAKDGTVLLDVTLVGPAIFHLAMVVEALEKAALKGQKHRGGTGRYQLSSIVEYLPDGNWRPYHAQMVEGFGLGDWLNRSDPPRSPWRYRIHCLRLRKNDHCLGEADWGYAFKTLALRRLDVLHTMFGAKKSTGVAWKELKTFLSTPGEVQESTNWDDWHRRSSTQNDKLVPMGGLTGEIIVHPPVGQERLWWRWWRTAELFHLGKETTMGNGKVTLRHSCKLISACNIENSVHEGGQRHDL
jgi:hypothetical protein